jgi:hypothetical protein
MDENIVQRLLIHTALPVIIMGIAYTLQSHSTLYPTSQSWGLCYLIQLLPLHCWRENEHCYQWRMPFGNAREGTFVNSEIMSSNMNTSHHGTPH